MQTPDIHNTLTSSSFLENISPTHLETISAFCSIEKYKTGDYIFRQGDLGEDLFIIVEGYVFLERAMDVGRHKGSVVIDALGKGRTLGCWSSLLAEPHVLMSSADCQKDTTVVRLKGKALRKCMEEDTPFGFFMLERLSFLLRERIQAAYGAMDKI
ncbi:Cyclic nucleotide-binding domain protein [Desulfosarcina cetonica]|uniref:Crp/Fnr family transcriptional regulator n=1 Tax=Desulfosarcina cetonica TaxID=90730 RepID=UPI0006D11AFA|nr:cyclic nucleotide-binding domain-containing protein [Desulfosarcina cetonica]VTR67221.1 Cyclic nucleotide-binding domain protein [Desulfosarcina cetonica]